MRHLFVVLAVFFTASCAPGARKQEQAQHLYPVRINGQYGFADTGGVLVVPAQYARVSEFTGGYAAFQDRGRKWGYLDAAGRVAIKPQFDEAGPFSDGLAPVRVADRWGYVRPDGAYALPPQYDAASAFAAGRALVSRDGRTGFVDAAGRVLGGDLKAAPPAAPAAAAARPPAAPQALPAAPDDATRQTVIANHISRARALFSGADYAAAAAECAKALALDPANAEALVLQKQITETQEILGGTK